MKTMHLLLLTAMYPVHGDITQISSKLNALQIKGGLLSGVARRECLVEVHVCVHVAEWRVLAWR